MNELYWITRCDTVHEILKLFLIITGVGSVFGFCFSMAELQSKHPDKYIIKASVIIGVFFAFFTVVYTLVPTTKEALIIYGIGGTIDYAKSDTILSKMPSKVIKACDVYLDSMIEEDLEE